MRENQFYLNGGKKYAALFFKRRHYTLDPAVQALKDAIEDGKPFAQALEDMKAAATAGMESTKDLAAKYGRSSRLGERSRGVLDAGSVSCCLLLNAMADGILEQL